MNLPLRLVDHLLDHLLPKRCAGCQAPLRPGAVLWCPPCRPAVDARFGHWGWPVWSLYTYSGSVRQCVRALKYQRRPQLAQPMGHLLWQHLAHEPWVSPWKKARLVPVPIPALRLAQRGYNVAGLLAQAVAPCAGAAAQVRCLERVSATARQVELNRRERRSNVAHAIRLRVRPTSPVVLVDDVVTTGATLDACKRTLEKAGVTVLGAITFAWVPAPEAAGPVRPEPHPAEGDSPAPSSNKNW